MNMIHSNRYIRHCIANRLFSFGIKIQNIFISRNFLIRVLNSPIYPLYVYFRSNFPIFILITKLEIDILIMCIF